MLGKDNDLGYGIMRVDEDMRWSTFYLGQPLWNFINMLVFEYGIAAYDLEIGKVVKGRKDKGEFWGQAKRVLGKIRRNVTRDYVVHPALSGPSALTTLSANATANLVRNVWTHSVIMCGHFPSGVQTFSKSSIEGETGVSGTCGRCWARSTVGLCPADWQPQLPDRAPPVPGPAQQQVPGDRPAGAGDLRAL